MRGGHCIKAWSKTQAVVAKSSAESELYAAVRACVEGLGYHTLCADIGDEVAVRTHLDASAAIGIVERRGLARVRHIDVDVLWIQEQQARRLLLIQKISGSQNPVGLMTKHVAGAKILKYLALMGLEFRDGRPDSAAQLHMLEASGGCCRE